MNRLAAVEPSLIRLYMDIAGESEAASRSVLMYVCCREWVTPMIVVSGVIMPCEKENYELADWN
jgi:hypothetical protein